MIKWREASKAGVRARRRNVCRLVGEEGPAKRQPIESGACKRMSRSRVLCGIHMRQERSGKSGAYRAGHSSLGCDAAKS